MSSCINNPYCLLNAMTKYNISPELAEFLNIDKINKVSRCDITKELCSYIKENNLQNEENRREIIADDLLKQLFHLDVFTYRQLQLLINQHIVT